MRGVTGDRSITDAAPIAEANVGSVVRVCVAKRPAVSGQAAIKAAVRIPARSKVHDSRLCPRRGHARRVSRIHRGMGGGSRNIMIAGGTSTGKTTLMRVLCG